MKLFIARDPMFNQLQLHSEKPKLKSKMYISDGVCFEPSQDIKEFFKDLTPEFGAQELNFVLDTGSFTANGERVIVGEYIGGKK